jgi:CheY-like chemotaxis protein
MTRILVVEDQPNDVQIAAQTARAAGVTDIEARTSAQAAISYLEKCLLGDLPRPDCIILDLDLGYESGYELLRFWHSTPELKKIPVIVWTLLGEEQREICNLFKIAAYVSKWEGAVALSEAFGKIQALNSHEQTSHE